MAQPYLSTLQALVAALGDPSDLVCRHFFGGAALYAKARICASLTPAGLAIKLPDQRCRELIEAGPGTPLRYFPNAPVKRGYILFADMGTLDDEVIAHYLEECVAHATRS